MKYLYYLFILGNLFAKGESVNFIENIENYHKSQWKNNKSDQSSFKKTKMTDHIYHCI